MSAIACAPVKPETDVTPSPEHPQKVPKPEPAVEYSAVMYIESGGGTLKIKVWHAQEKDRTEITVLGSRRITILRKDKDIQWTLLPGQKTYIQKPRNKKVQEREKKLRYYKIGNNTLSGVETTVIKVTRKTEQGEKTEGRMWVTKDGIAIKSEFFVEKGGERNLVSMELKNLQTGRLDPSLFEIPRGYNEFFPHGSGIPGRNNGGTGSIIEKRKGL